MRTLTIGAVLFVIWAFFSTWLFVDILRPALKKPVETVAVPETTDNVADSLAKIYALMPKDLVIHHDFDKAGIISDPQLEVNLNDFKNWLEKYPESMLLITGHSDLVGTPEYNQELGMERAKSALKYLESNGFQSSRIIVESKGETEPVAGYITAEGRAKNRRTVISIKK
jgi:outer membrane protein OmpA-like peptidoglycan-associated protein